MSSVPSSSKRPLPPSRVAGTRAWRSLGARLALWYVVVALGSSTALAVVVAIRTDALVAREGQHNADSTLEHYRRALEDGGVAALRLLTAREPAGPDYALRLTDEREVELLTVASDEAASQVAIDVRARGEQPSRGGAPAPARNWNVAVASVSQGRRLEIVVHNDVGTRLWHHTWEDLAIIFAVGLGTAILGAFVISRRALRPLTALAQATQRIVDSGDLTLRVPERGADDLDALTRLFNRMLARNEALVLAMKHSLDNVAHDLRTPLTRLRAGAELALTGSGDADAGEAARSALADTIEESDRVLATLTTLMDITGAETGAMHLDKRPEDLSEIAREAVDLYDHVSSERGVRVVTHLAPGVEVMGDHQRILQVAANLLDNALKYTAAGGRAEVSVTKDERWGILAIRDTGRGIALADRPHVWERLFRGDRSRTEHGLGLGLSLVKAVVGAHGGEVALTSEDGEGSTFEVRLPLSKRTVGGEAVDVSG